MVSLLFAGITVSSFDKEGDARVDDPGSSDGGRWPAIDRNAGRLHSGMAADIKSEYPAGLNRNPHKPEGIVFHASGNDGDSSRRALIEQQREVVADRRREPMPVGFLRQASICSRQPVAQSIRA
jgi:hypothetical protein